MSGTPFWQEIRKSLMVRGEGWKEVVEQLPDVLSWREARKYLQSKEQLKAAGLDGLGHVAGVIVRGTLDSTALDALPDHTLDFDNCAVQWLYSYYIVESIVEHWRAKPLAEWPPAHLTLVLLHLHFMVWMAALMCLFAEGSLSPLSSGLFEYTVGDVKARLQATTANLHPKAQDYGESFRRHGLPGVIPRLWDKIARITTLKADNRPANFEKLEDSVRDLLGYSTIAFSLVMEVPEHIRTGQAEVVAAAHD